MNTLQYLRKRYPTGFVPASYNHLEYIEKLSRSETLDIREVAENGKINIEAYADFLNSL